MKFLSRAVFIITFVLCGTYTTKSTAHAAYPLGTEAVFYNCEGAATATTTNLGTGGAAYDGTFGGNASTSALVAKFGSRSCSFGETGDYMKTYFASSTDPTSQSISVSMWVYKKEASNGCNSGDADHFFGSSGQPSGSRFYLRCNPVNRWGMRFGSASAADATTTVNHQAWEHIALVFDAANDTPKMYVNNVLRVTSGVVSSYTIRGDFYLGMANDTITNPGSLNLSEGANAYIDDIAFYNAALSANEIASLYNAGTTPGQPTSLTATPYENKVFLSWVSPGGTFDDYKVEYKLSSEPTTWTTFTDGVSTTASTTVTGLVNGSTYDFRVSTLNGELVGTPSATVSTIPYYRIAFVSPTSVTANSTTTSTIATVYASSTNLTSSTTHTIRLETGAGSLVSQVSTTTRYGNQNLTTLISQGIETDLALDDNSSGIAYVSTTNSLFVVHNRGIGVTSEIDEISTTGTLIRTINCTSCGDIEGIALISSVASTTALGVYDHTFMISTENGLTNAEIFRVVIPSPAASTTALTKSDNFLTGITHGSNTGLEGIAYNPTSGVFYVAEEKSNPTLYEVTLGPSHTTSTSTICTNLNFTTIATDFSDLTYSNGILYLLSDEDNRLIPLDISSTSTCKYVDSDGDNGGVPSTIIDTGDFLNSLIATNSPAGAPQPEGVTWDSNGEYLYVLAEGDFLKKYRAPITIRHTFTGLTTGSYALKSTYLDTNGVTANASPLNFGVDTTGPVSSNIASTTGETTATITWDTDEAATSKVSYGTVSSTYTTSTSSASLVTSHSLGLTGLSASTRYYYVVVTSDNLGNFSTSSEKSLLTTAPPDSTAPSATLTAPANATTVSGASVSLTATASDNTAVAGVKFYVDGVLIGSEDATSAYTGTWDSTTATEGSHTVIAVARDTSNNYGTSTASTVTVDNVAPVRSSGTPSGTLAAGTTGTTIGLTTNETATCKYSTSAATAYGSMTVFSSSNSTTHSSSVTGLSNGSSYTYYVKCADVQSNVNAADYSISFTVASDTTDPSATLTAPTNAATVSGASVSITASASDDGAVAGVKFYINGTLQDVEDTTSTYGITWDSTGVVDGSYTIFAVARDTSNNYGTSSSVTVTVNNTTPPTPEPERSTKRSGSSTALSRALALLRFNQAPVDPLASPFVRPSVTVASRLSRPLYFSLANEQVRTLQKVLNGSADTQVSLTGPGSPGNETSLFFTKTLEAVKKFQLKYKIVTSVDDPGYGYVGPATRRKINELLFN